MCNRLIYPVKKVCPHFVTRFIFIGMILLLLSPLGLSLDPHKKITQYIQESWGTEQGLPQVTVHTIIQTRQGYLWLGTQEGLVRFDGVHFKIFDKSRIIQLKNNWIWTLFEDRKGNLWIGTDGGGLTVMKGNNFTTYTTEQGLSNNMVRAIYEDYDGNIWIGTEEGLNRLYDGKFIHYSKKQGLSDDKIRCIYQDRKKNLWIGTYGGGLNCLAKGNITSYTTRDGLSDNRITAIYEPQEGNLWIGTNGGGLNILSPEKITSYTTKDGLSDNRITAIYQDQYRNLWIGTYGGGVNRLYNGKFTSFTTKEGLSDDFVLSLCVDSEKSLWIGTGGGGLNRLKDGKFTPYTTGEGLSDNLISCIFEDNEKNLWIGTYGGGLNQLKNDKVKVYTTALGLSNNLIRSLHQDRQGNLWIGTDNGLNRFANGKFTIFNQKQGLSNPKVWCIHEDRKGRLWVGTDNGLNCLKDNTFTCFSKDQGLSNDRIMCIHEDKQGNLWIGTNGGGLNRLNESTALEFTTYTTKEGLSSDMVWALYEDEEGTLWIGTRGGGLNRFKNGVFTRFTFHDGLFDDIVYQVLEDDRGYFWMSCNKGIFKVNKWDLNAFAEGKIPSFKCTSYNEKDGMKSRECNGGTQPPGWKTRDGKLWFPTIKGIIMIDPTQIAINSIPPPVVIENIIANDRNLNIPGPLPGEKILLPPGTARLEIQYTGLSLLEPANVRFKYRLVGFDRDWFDVGTRRTAFYTKLPPGYYTFRVIASNNDGIWNETGTSISLYQKPYFHQTFWFYLIGALVLGGIAAGGYLLRVHQYKTREAKLCILVNERTKELNELNLDLENKISEKTNELLQAKKRSEEAKELAEQANRAKSMFLTNMSHEIRTPLNAIMGFAEILGKEIADERQKQLLEGIANSGQALLGLINNILDLSRIETGKMDLQYESVNPFNILTEIKRIFSLKVKEKGLDFKIETDPKLPEFLLLDSLRLRQILFNLVENAVKFTHTGFIKLSVTREGSQESNVKSIPGNSDTVEITFSVQDSGIGIPEDQQKYIFETFAQVEGQGAYEYGGAGVGLAITQRLTRMLGGTIALQSTEGKGTLVQVTFKSIEVAGRPKPGEIGVESDTIDQKEIDIESVRFEPVKILIADDQDLSRELLLEYLDNYPGIQTLQAEDGKEAIKLIRLHHPGLVLLDLEMPEIDGYGVIELIKADESLKEIPIIAITGYDFPETQGEIDRMGSDGFLRKPVNQESLIRQLVCFLPHTYSDGDQVSEYHIEKILAADSLSLAVISKLPSLISILEHDYYERWKTISKTFFLEDIDEFARDIVELGDQLPLILLKNWGEKLSKEVKRYDMLQTAHTLQYFPELIDRIKQFSAEKGGKQGKGRTR